MKPTTTNAERAQAAQHTPGEWLYKEGMIYAEQTGETIATLHDWQGDSERESNGSLIVRAVNSHQALVDALGDLREMVSNVLTDSQLDSPQLGGARALCAKTIRNTMAVVDAALKLATS